MAKIEIIKTELVWLGKYNEDGTFKEVPRVNLPFQVIETSNESRATREGKKTYILQRGNWGHILFWNWGHILFCELKYGSVSSH